MTQKTNQKTNQSPKSLQDQVKDAVGDLPTKYQGLITGLVGVINGQGQAILELDKKLDQLTEIVAAHTPSFKSSGNGAGDEVAAVSEVAAAEQVGGSGGNQLADLAKIMSMIQGLGGKPQPFDAAAIEAMVAQRDAINRLIPPSPYEQLAEQVGVAVLQNFAKKIGVEAIAGAK